MYVLQVMNVIEKFVSSEGMQIVPVSANQVKVVGGADVPAFGVRVLKECGEVDVWTYCPDGTVVAGSLAMGEEGIEEKGATDGGEVREISPKWGRIFDREYKTMLDVRSQMGSSVEIALYRTGIPFPICALCVNKGGGR